MTASYTKAISLDPIEIKQAIIDIIKGGEVPMVHGHPGIGKSAIFKQIAEEFNLELIDIRLSQIDPVDLNGFIKVKDDNPDLATYVPIELFPLKGQKLPKGKSGWLINLDELPSCAPSIQAAAYKLLLDRMVGNKYLHEKVALGAAGNLITSNAIAYEMGTATKSRLCHLVLEPSANAFYVYAEAISLDSRILSFLRFRPKLVFDFNPNTEDFTFAAPRTWHKLSNIIKNIPTPELFGYRRKIIAGTVGTGAGNEFISFLKIYSELPTLSEIEDDPENINLSQEPSVLFALTGFIEENMTLTNAAQLMKFVDRMPIEFQIITMQPILKRKEELRAHASVANWTLKNSARMVKRNGN